MCGIAGIITKHSNQYIGTMTEAIAHRGPDGSGVYSDGDLSLGHQRLSILDLTDNGAQPMFSDDKNHVIVFNGEIYNHWDIRKELEPKYNFTSTCDTETLLYAYIEWGADMLQKLNGIFAFAIYDKSAKKLFIARDHYGIKPLYFYQSDELIAFSSELKAITALPDVHTHVDLKGMVNYLNFLWSPGEQTPVKEIVKILPAHYLEIDVERKHVSSTKYYQIPFDGNYTFNSEKETIDLLDQKLNDAVERQLLADVEVGFFLSGGLDSSLLTAIASKKLDYAPKCFTVKSDDSFEGFTPDLAYARKVAEAYKLPLIEVPVEVDIVDEFDRMIFHLDEPQADPAPLNVLKICEQARANGVKVMIGGTAGDDLFSGYRRHVALKLERYLDATPLVIRKALKKMFAQMDSNKPTIRRIQKILNGAHLNGQQRRANYFSWIQEENLKMLFNSEARAEIENFKPNQYLIDRLQDIPNESNHLNQMLYWEMISFLVDHNLNYTDKMSMAVGVEVRVPFLDRDLVDFACKIDPALKLKGKETKYILKKVAERYLPNDVIYRPKTGFGAPVREWIINDLDDFIHQRLSEDEVNAQGIFNFATIQEMIKQNKEGKVDASYTIWSLLAINSWLRQFFDKK